LLAICLLATCPPAPLRVTPTGAEAPADAPPTGRGLAEEIQLVTSQTISGLRPPTGGAARGVHEGKSKFLATRNESVTRGGTPKDLWEEKPGNPPQIGDE